jgi:hypothetical protein
VCALAPLSKFQDKHCHVAFQNLVDWLFSQFCLPSFTEFFPFLAFSSQTMKSNLRIKGDFMICAGLPNGWL